MAWQFDCFAIEITLVDFEVGLASMLSQKDISILDRLSYYLWFACDAFTLDNLVKHYSSHCLAYLLQRI